MEFLGGNADLCAVAEFAAVGEPGGGVHIDHSRIHSTLELLGNVQVTGDDALGVFGAVLGDMRHCILQAVCHLDGDLIVVEFRVVQFFGHRLNRIAQNLPGLFVAVNGHIVRTERRLHSGQNLCGNVLMDDQSLDGVADGRALGLGIVNDAHCHFIIRLAVQAAVHVDVAVSGTSLDDRHGRLAQHRLNQTGAATGNQHIQVSGKVHHVCRCLTGSILYQLNDIPGQSHGLHCIPHDLRQCGVGMDRLFAATENDNISGFQTKGRRIHGNIGTGLKDNADNAQRHTGLEDLQTVGTDRAAVHRTDRIFRSDQLTCRICHTGNTGRCQPQAILERCGHVILHSRLQVFGIGGENLLLPGKQGIGNGGKGVVFHLGCGSGNGGFHSLCLDAKGFCIVHGNAPFRMIKSRIDD